jgi:peptide/nickel transport system permease protein
MSAAVVPSPVTGPRRTGGFASRLGLTGWVSLVIIALLVLMALLAPLLPVADPDRGVVTDRLAGIGTDGHLLGTDKTGRDILSRMVWGARTSLLAGILPVVVGGLLGTLVGVAAAMGPRWLHTVLMRTLDVFFAFPALLLAIVIAATFSPGLITVMAAITVIVAPPVARVAEAEAARVREADYIQVARASGATWPAIVRTHVSRAIAPAIAVYCTSLVGLAIVYSSGLSFIGLGVTPPTADWGAMINELRSLIFTKPELALLPALPVLVVAICFNLLGDALRDALAVESREL